MLPWQYLAAARRFFEIESFLHHLAYLESAGQLSQDWRMRICQDVAWVLSRVRGLGLTVSGQPAAGLGADFPLTTGDVPRGPPSRLSPVGTYRRRSCAS